MRGISVIIPCYNRERTLGLSIESVLNQLYDGNVEIIVSDDGSKDNSLKVARKYVDNVILLSKPANCIDQGPSGARNRGLAVAKYDYICFLDSDDYFLPDFLHKMSEGLDFNVNLGYVFCRAKISILNTNGTKTLSDWTKKRISKLDVKYGPLAGGNVIWTGSLMIRKSVIDKAGAFNTDYNNGEDNDMWIRIGEISQGGFINFYGAVYCFGEKNQITKKLDQEKIYSLKASSALTLARTLQADKKDNVKLLLLFRNFLYEIVTHKRGLFFKAYRFVVVNIKLIVIFPITYFRYQFLKFKHTH